MKFEGEPGIFPGELMVKVNIENLSGKALDWAVAMAKERPGTAAMIVNTNGICNYKPSSDPAIAWPIIFENEIGIFPLPVEDNGMWCATLNKYVPKAKDHVMISYRGKQHPFVLAMRVFIFSKMKLDTLEIPAILVTDINLVIETEAGERQTFIKSHANNDWLRADK